jgi:hypothetical protein
MNDDLEQRLRAYGSTIDTATETDLAERHEHAVETSVRNLDRRPRRTAAAIAVLAIAAIAAVGVVTITHRSHAAVDAPSSTVPPSPSCLSVTQAQRRACKRLRHPHGNQPQYSDLGSGTDGDPTPAQAAALAVELRQYDPVKVQAMVKEAERNGNHPTDQALVSAFEYQNACRQAFTAAVAAKSAPANRVASVVNGIINPEITRLRARSTSGSTGYVGFEQVAQQLIAGQALQVIRSFGHTFCGYEKPAYWKGLEPLLPAGTVAK